MGTLLFNISQDIEAICVGQRDGQKDKIIVTRFNVLYKLFAGTNCFDLDIIEVFPKDLGKSLLRYGMVIDDQNTDFSTKRPD